MKELERPRPELTDYSRMPQFLYPQQQHSEFEAAQPSISPTHYLLVVWRQKWRIVAFVATALLTTYLVSSRLTPIYEATAKIDVDRGVPTGVVGQEASQGSAGDDSDAFMATQMEIIQSDAVLRPVTQRFHLLERERQVEPDSGETARRKSDAPVYLKQLKITRPITTYILDISYRSPDPQLAADVANAIAQSYLEDTFEIRVKSSGALSAFMEKQLDGLKARMERSSQALAKFEQQLNVINPEDKTNILSARLLQLNTDYTRAQSDRMNKEAAFKAMQSGTLASAMVTAQGQDLGRLQDRLNQAKQHLADVGAIYGPNHSEYRKAKTDVDEVERQFEEATHTVSLRVDADYKEAMGREEMLRKAVAATKAEYDQLNSRSFEYQQLKREADTDKTLYSDLERRIREATINSGFRNSSIRIADSARPPDAPVFPNKKLNLLLAFLASSILAICAAILADVLDNSIRDPEQVAKALDTTVLGALPTVKEMRRLINPGAPVNLVQAPDGAENGANHDASRRMIRYNADEAARKSGKRKALVPSSGSGYQGISSYEEAIRTLRHSILLPDLDRVVRSLLVTSAAPGEGKSTAIIHLGIANAEQGKKTLIIDADLRRPSIHKKLNISGTLGLSNVLLGELRWRETIVKCEQWPDLDIVPSGTASRRASDLVGSMMVEILDEASKEYDLILVDAPPLLGFAEAMQVARSVDGVVVMARAGETSKRAVATVLATLKRLRANTLGLVLNEVDKSSTHGGYYYYSEYRKYYAEPADRRS